MPAIIKEDYLKELQADPDRPVDVIIRTKADPLAHATQVEDSGLTVTRTIKLIKAIAATGPAKAVLALAAEPWVASIEPDQAVRTMGGSP